MSAPLRILLRQDAQFEWDQAHEQAFQKIKETLTAEPGPVLAYFDPQKEVTLQVDASKNGLGATIMQNGKPVAYASKLLNTTEQNYAQIEKELYAVLYGCKRFHDYIYGRHITVESDHKPLESILRKPFALAPPRLQRMLLALQKYSITLIHKPGKEIPVADTLSRKSMEDSDSSLAEAMATQVHTIVKAAPVSAERLEDIKAATAQDEQLSALKRIIQSGWPETRRECPTLVIEYWNHRDEITEADGLLLKGERIIIPLALRQDMLQRIHTGHFGVEKSKHRARDIMFWPGMSKQIDETVMNCDVCQTHRSSNQKEPMLPQEIPENPWQTVGTDLLSWNSENYIVICDYLSRYFELERLPNITTAA
uniref:Gypsy retrotransposon integrase-like protein 1 n=1 Tax=Neogobius melanostomus TaxID=47308 RepID=A0A8C6UJ08_9GOBI